MRTRTPDHSTDDATFEDEDVVSEEAEAEEEEEAEVLDDEADTARAISQAEADQEPLAEDEVEIPNDVEVGLDRILDWTIRGRELDDAEAKEFAAPANAEQPLRSVGPDEFICRSCFLVKRRTQLCDPQRSLCSDCV
jgi:hypothetical protein